VPSFCSLCGTTDPADLGDVIGICLDATACHQRQYRRLRDRAEAAEAERDRLQAKLDARREYDTYRRALWVLVRQFDGDVFLTSGQMENVPLMASLGCGREPGGLRIVAEEEP
jgi:hypothetical protein